MDVKKTVSEIQKKYGKGAIKQLGVEEIVDVPKFSSGSKKLDKALGGGIPYGMIVEFMGWESSGKSSISLIAIKEVQYDGKLCGYIDVEHTFDPVYAKSLGVDVESLYLSQPDCGEEAADITEMLIKSGEFGLIVIDSVAAMTPRAEIEGDFGDSKMGLHARLMSQTMRKLVASCKRHGTTVLFINQFREKIGVMYGDSKVTTGGNALKFFAAQRLEIIKSKNINEGDDIVGYINRIKVKKNKVGTPFKEAEVIFMLGKGFDEEYSEMKELIEECIENGVIEKAGGGWMSFNEFKLGQGDKNVIKLLNDNPELVEELQNKLQEVCS
jgi:recombination protein RecA